VSLPRCFPSASLVLLLAASVRAQTTWYVDDDGPGDPFPGVSIPGNPAFSDPLESGTSIHPFDDMEKAIVAAVSGDTILVRPSNVIGFYALTSRIELLNKDLVIRSTGGADVTVLDGTGIPGVEGMFVDSECVIDGFTFQAFDHGSLSAAQGGAMVVQSASPTIRRCVFTGNHAYIGGGVLVNQSNGLFVDCLFTNNTAVHQGGGGFNESGKPTYRRCTFVGNSANFGGAFLSRTSVGAPLITVEDSVFTQNHSNVTYGGALAKFDGGSILIQRTRFIDNEAAGEGGGAILSGPATVRSSTFNGNVSGSNNGGGLFIGAGSVVGIESSTFTGNQGGAVVEDPAITFGTMVNCISWANSPFELSINVGVTYSDVMGGYTGVGNVDVDPLFEDALGPDGIAATLDDDLSLFGASPCIDAGNASAVQGSYPTDLAGGMRVVDHPGIPDTGVAWIGQSVDLGAYEIQRVCNPQRTGARRQP